VERAEEPEGRAALGLGFERPADIAVRPNLVREDVPDRAHEHAMERRGLAGEGFGYGVGLRLCSGRLRHGRSFAGQKIYSPIPICNRNPTTL
jgi:hypothetical protein